MSPAPDLLAQIERETYEVFDRIEAHLVALEAKYGHPRAAVVPTIPAAYRKAYERIRRPQRAADA